MVDIGTELDRLRNLSLDELRMLNKAVCQLINERDGQEQLKKAAQLHVGLRVKFEGRNGVMFEGIITRVNPKMSKVECDKPHRINYKVLNTLLEVV